MFTANKNGYISRPSVKWFICIKFMIVSDLTTRVGMAGTTFSYASLIHKCPLPTRVGHLSWVLGVCGGQVCWVDTLCMSVSWDPSLSVLSTLYSVLYTLYSVLYTLYYVLYTLYSVLCVGWTLYHAWVSSGTLHSLYSRNSTILTLL